MSKVSPLTCLTPRARLTLCPMQVLFGGSEPWPTFHAVNDTLRGGSSSSAWTVDERSNVATFKGHLGASPFSQCAS